MKLKPRAKPPKTSEDPREEQRKALTENTVCTSRGLEKRAVRPEHNKKGREQYRMRSNSPGPAHAGQGVGNFFQVTWKATGGF